MVRATSGVQCWCPTRRSHGGRRRAGLAHQDDRGEGMSQTLEGRPAGCRLLGRRDEALRGDRATFSTGGAAVRRDAGGQVPRA